MSEFDRKQRFIHELAVFLSGSAAADSIQIEMEAKSGKKGWAHRWAALRSAGPMLGWSTVEETEAALTHFLE